MFVIDPEKCTQCGECMDICPCGAVVEQDDGTFAIDKDLCAECAVCQVECAFEAISEIDFAAV